MAKKDGGPAFPYEQHETQDGTWNQTTEIGLTKREWFAGMALAGIIKSAGLSTPEYLIARYSFEQADAMIKESEKED